MKRILSMLLVFFMASSAMAQSPELLSYQAVIRNATGDLIIEKNISIKISILQKTDDGQSVFTETHVGTTNKNGLLTIKIGDGTIVSGNFSTINWSDGPYFLKTETDPQGGTAYSINNTSQLLSAPYALFAKSAGDAWKLTGNIATDKNFIGTINNQPLVFKVNNQRAGYIDNGNSFWGVEAGVNNTGSDNTAAGYRSMFTNTTGSLNVATGNYSLNSNTAGSYNVSQGYKSLYFNTVGNSNSVNGYQGMYSNSDGGNNVANGMLALYSNSTGSSNVANGANALYHNTIAGKNVANGFNAMYNNTTGEMNVANGSSALFNNKIGDGNVATGYESLYQNTTGLNNVANGYKALHDNTTGNYNVANGTDALPVNITGNNNSANGCVALQKNLSGSNNVANGYAALAGNLSGESNVGIGTYALVGNSTGIGNTALGDHADVSSNDLRNATAIGNHAKVNASNKIRLGNSFVTVIEGQVAFSFPSDARFKYNIKHDVPGLDFIKKLQPVTYYFDNEKLDEFTKTGVINKSNIFPVSYKGEKEIHTGFLAQDVEKTANELGYHFDGVHAPSNDKDHYSLAYSQFIMPLVKGMQEQQVMIDQQNNNIDLLNKTVDQQDKLNDQQKINLVQLNKTVDLQNVIIEQLKNMIRALEIKVDKLSK